MNLDNIIKESINEFLINELFNKNKYANLVNSAIMNLESCLFYPQIENVNATKVPQEYLEMASIFNAGHTLANQLMATLKQIQATINYGKNVKESHIFESPSISSLIPSQLRNWNPVRDFAVGAKRGMNGVEKAFGKNGSQNGRANSKDMKTQDNAYMLRSANLKNILDSIFSSFSGQLQEFANRFTTDKNLQQQLVRYTTYINVEIKSCYKLITVANNLRYSGIENANFKQIRK